MFPRPPTYTLTGTLFPDTTPYRSESGAAWSDGGDGSSNPAIGPGGRSDFAGPEDDPLARLGETPSLRDHLAAQLAVEIVDPIDRMIGHHLIDSLDEAGWLAAAPDAVAAALGCAADRVVAVLDRKSTRLNSSH